uniref:Uncharacterized protein n=1 Tax=Rhizochromulina marina TaxID=1034831 RepID=A0A7S2SSZ4_9STRA
MTELGRFLKTTQHGPGYRKFKDWLLESYGRKLEAVSYDEVGAMGRDAMVSALKKYYRWCHSSQNDTIPEQSEQTKTHWFWGKSGQVDALELEKVKAKAIADAHDAIVPQSSASQHKDAGPYNKRYIAAAARSFLSLEQDSLGSACDTLPLDLTSNASVTTAATGAYNPGADPLNPKARTVKETIDFYRTHNSQLKSALPKAATGTKTLKTYQSLGEQGYYTHVKRSSHPPTTLEKPALEIPGVAEMAGTWSKSRGRSVRFPFPPVISAEERVSDKALLSFDERPFVPRDSMEHSFHAVLRRLSHLLHHEINNTVPTFPSSMLKPPKGAVHPQFFPNGVWQEDKDYLVTRLDKREDQPRSHQYLGNYRKSDEVVFFADRNPIHGKRAQEKRTARIKTMYTRKKGPLKSIHSSTPWMSVLAKHDKYTDSGRGALLHDLKMKELGAKQQQWVGQQSAMILQRRERCAHLVHLLNQEICTDERRELRMLDNELDARQRKQIMIDVAKERTEAADKIMRIMEEYGMLSGGEAADYLLHSLKHMRSVAGDMISEQSSLRHGGSKSMIGRKRQEHTRAKDLKKAVDTEKGGDLDPTKVLGTGLAKGKPGSAKQQTKKKMKQAAKVTRHQGPGGDPTKSGGLYVPSRETYQPRKAKPVTESFQNAGMGGGVRMGEFSDKATVPAAISFNDALYAGEEQIVPDDGHRWPNGDMYSALWSEAREAFPGQEKSYESGKILEAIRDKQTDPVTGQAQIQEFALFERASAHSKTMDPRKKEKSMYSSLLGRELRVVQ